MSIIKRIKDTKTIDMSTSPRFDRWEVYVICYGPITNGYKSSTLAWRREAEIRKLV